LRHPSGRHTRRRWPRDLPGTVDLLPLDGHKPLYDKNLALIAPRLRAGSYVVADNADACPADKAHIRAADYGYLSIPFGEDVELTMKL
jgi:predicted O-methyltransferase YrrM